MLFVNQILINISLLSALFLLSMISNNFMAKIYILSISGLSPWGEACQTARVGWWKSIAVVHWRKQKKKMPLGFSLKSKFGLQYIHVCSVILLAKLFQNHDNLITLKILLLLCAIYFLFISLISAQIKIIQQQQWR